MTLHIATRRSALALWQAEATQVLLKELGLDAILRPTETTGDRIQSTALSLQQLPLDHPARQHVSTGKGLFIKEVQDLLLSGECQVAVHSMKDLPVHATPGLSLAGFLPAAPAADVLIVNPQVLPEFPFADLMQAHSPLSHVLPALDAVAKKLQKPIGTTSTRRHALLRELGVQNAEITILRGNVDSRLKRVEAGEFAAILLAQAGLQRLGLFDPQRMLILTPEQFIPACAQGVVGMECPDHQCDLIHQVFLQSEMSTLMRLCLERLVLARLGGDCHSAIGIHVSGDFHAPNTPRILRIFTSAHLEHGHSRSEIDLDTQPWSEVCTVIQNTLQTCQQKVTSSFSEFFATVLSEKRVTEVFDDLLVKEGHLHNVGQL